MEFEVNQEVKFKEGKFTIISKEPTPQGFYNYVIQNIKTGMKQRIGGSVISMKIENAEKEKRLKKFYKRAEKLGKTKEEIDLMRDESTIVPYINNKNYNQQYFESLGFLAKYSVISAQVPPHSENSFDFEYYEDKGKTPEKGHGSYYYFCSDETWSPTIRIRIKLPEEFSITYFTFWPYLTEIRELSDNEIEINNVNWGHELFKIGFDLGSNHDIKEILSNIPERYHSDFKNGLNLI